MAGRGDARRAVDVEPDVVGVRRDDALAGVEAHADPDGSTPSGQRSPARARWAATAAATAAARSWKTAKNESPSVLTTCPPASPTAARIEPLVALEDAP